MEAFVAPFNMLLGNPADIDRLNTNPHLVLQRHVTSQARFCVEIWRSAIILSMLNPEFMSVSMPSVISQYRENPPTFQVTSDGSPTGVGLIVRDSVGVIVFYASVPIPSVTGAKFQNATEYLSFIVSVVMLLQNCTTRMNGATIQWTTDSAVSLDWLNKNKCQGKFSQLAYMFLSIIALRCNLRFSESVKIAGSEMESNDVDSLSRGLATPRLNSYHRVTSHSNATLVSLLQLLDPTVQDVIKDHHEAYLLLREVANVVCRGV